MRKCPRHQTWGAIELSVDSELVFPFDSRIGKDSECCSGLIRRDGFHGYGAEQVG